MMVHTPAFSSRLASVLESYWNKINVSKEEGTLIKYSLMTTLARKTITEVIFLKI